MENKTKIRVCVIGGGAGGLICSKRLLEKNSDFSDKFIKVSRDVHFMNDKRAKVKKEINRSFGSNIEEVKEYTKY